MVGIKGKPLTEEHKKKVSFALRGHIVTKETRKKIGLKKRGQKHTYETKRKISKSKQGQIHTKETKKKISNTLSGRKLSDEHIKKLSKANKGERNPAFGSKYWLGKKHTLEAKEKMRKAKLGKARNKHKPKTILKMQEAWTPERRKSQSKYMMDFVYPKTNTKPERFMQSVLSVNGIKHETHKPFKIGNSYHQVDIFIKPNICIEVDGKYWHSLPKQIKRDKIIDKGLRKQDYEIIRFWDHEIYNNPLNCLNVIKNWVGID